MSLTTRKQAHNQLGTPGGRRVFWEWRIFFKLRPILSNYVQHIFSEEVKIFLGEASPPLVTGLRSRQCFLQVSRNTLQQVETFKYLGVVFTRNESRNKGIDTRICKAKAVLRKLYCSVVTKRELSKNAKLSDSKSVFVAVPHLWSLILGDDWKNTVKGINGRDGIFAKRSRGNTSW